MDMVCEVCGQKMVVKTIDFDYTQRAGLDPERHVIVLKNIESLWCDCGVAPRIPNVEGLHYTIGLVLIRDEAPLDGSAVRFLRKTLGMTQREFSATFDLTPEYYSDWERGKTLPKKPVRIAAAATFLTHLLKRREALVRMAPEYVAETVEKVTSRTLELAERPRGRALITVDASAHPPAWQIAEFMRLEAETGGTRHRR